MTEIDFESEGLLEGLDGEARDSRRALLAELAADGVTVEELRAATREGRLALIPVERLLNGAGEPLTLDEVIDRSGADRRFVERFLRATGIPTPEPEEAAFSEGDLDAIVRARAFIDAGLPEERVLEIARVLSRSMAAVAATMHNAFGEAFARPGDQERDLALRYAQALEGIAPMIGPVVLQALNVQQRSLLRQTVLDDTVLATGRLPGAQEMTFCFADLVGFTKLGERVAAAELGAVAERLEELAAAVAEPPVRLVKTIGDAVMLGSPDPDAALEAALALVAAADGEAEGFPALRAGAATGEAIGRAGDWFGSPVNLASRVTGIARPGTVLAEAATKEAAQREWAWSFAGKRSVKGVGGELALFRVRAPGPQG